MLNTLLEFGANTEALNANGNTPLHHAANLNRSVFVKELLARGADVNAQNPETSRTPLHLAVLYLSEECVEILLDFGADPEQLDKYNKTPMDLIDSDRIIGKVFSRYFVKRSIL